jgi:valyl-tRNA synthetase
MQSPARACKCGSKRFQPDTDVMDTWATSSTSPQIVTGWLTEPDRFAQLFPLTLRPQAHEIIRTWAFYSIVKSYYHFGKLPWSDIFISGWAIAGEGMGKISKSRGGGPLTPMTMIQQYSADAVRYWAASTSPGKDSIISVEKIQMGNRLVTKLWNVARFVEPFISGELPPAEECSFTPADRWILARCRRLIHQVTADFERYDYAAVKNELDSFFWHNLADNYLEMAKQRLYDGQHPAHYGACRAVKIVFNVVLKLFAPLLPYITDTIYQELFGSEEDCASIHAARWPDVLEMDGIGLTEADDDFGEMLIAIASAVRRYKSENALSLGSELPGLYLASGDDHLLRVLRLSAPDLGSVTRALNVEAGPDLPPGCLCLTVEEDGIQVGILLNPTPERA